jgi:hypothetical protein
LGTCTLRAALLVLPPAGPAAMLSGLDPALVGTNKWVSLKSWIAITAFGTPSLTSSAAAVGARRIDRPRYS